MAADEARRTNVLLEELQGTLRVVAEDQRALRSEFSTFKLALEDVAENLKLLTAAVKANTAAITTLEKSLCAFDERLKFVEAKV